MATGKDAYDMLSRIRYDLSAMQAKVTDLFSILNDLDVRDVVRPTCENCGLSFKTALMRDEHLYHAHGGAVPPHWVRAEAVSEERS
jgi:hypothetical protein